MSKYRDRGPYHFFDFVKAGTEYHGHVSDMVNAIGTYAGKCETLHEVGCGEGLILSQIRERTSLKVSGNDADRIAVDMGKMLLPKIPIILTDRMFERTNTFDVVLFSDSLEHIETLDQHIEWAKASKIVVIAIPSIHDRHAIRQLSSNSFDSMFRGWNCLERSTRCARHVIVWGKP